MGQQGEGDQCLGSDEAAAVRVIYRISAFIESITAQDMPWAEGVVELRVGGSSIEDQGAGELVWLEGGEAGCIASL